MQTAMLRLDAFLRRRRRAVLIAWAAILLAAVPFAARQSEDLSSGGFGVPGSQSAAVDEALGRFPGVQRAQLAAVLVPQQGASEAQLRAAVDRVGAAAGPVGGVSLAPDARARALEQAAAGGTVLVPLAAEVDEDDATAVAVDLRERLAVADGPRAGVATHLVGQGALWAAMQDLSKEDLAKAESAGFPVVLLILLAVFGSFAAAMLPLALGVGSVLLTGALIFGLSQTMEMSVFVTNMASMIGIGVAVDYSLFVVARYREEVARRALAGAGAGGGDGDLRARGAVLRADRDHLARRAVDARQHRDPLDGARGDARRRRRDARRDDAAAGADRAARAARPHALAAVQPHGAAAALARAGRAASGSAGPTP